MKEDAITSLIERLGLVPHPEGGHYREMFRSATTVDPGDGRRARSAMTCIHFLLAAGQHSRWHRVESDELWLYQRGDPLELFVAAPVLERVERVVLGAADRLQHAVPAGYWQAARPRGVFSLCACAVAPGFEFEDFSFLADDAVALARLRGYDSDLAGLA